MAVTHLLASPIADYDAWDIALLLGMVCGWLLVCKTAFLSRNTRHLDMSIILFTLMLQMVQYRHPEFALVPNLLFYFYPLIVGMPAAGSQFDSWPRHLRLTLALYCLFEGLFLLSGASQVPFALHAGIGCLVVAGTRFVLGLRPVTAEESVAVQTAS